MGVKDTPPDGGEDRRVAVIDVGKTNIKLAIASREGVVLDQVQTANPILADPGEPWRRHDLAASEHWILGELKNAAARHDIGHIVASGHGSAGVLISPGDLDRPEPVLPMLDYEQTPPTEVAEAYVREAGDFFDRGSAIMLATTHQARQILWVEEAWPERFAAADAFLGVPQYWAWRLCGERSGEVTFLAAQADLWNVREKRPSSIVARRGWHHLMPKLQPANRVLGTIRPEVAAQTGLPRDCRMLVGIHDSSANFYRYQAAGLSHMTVVSTGTWIVALSDHADLDRLDPSRGMTLNADISGQPLGGTLTMGGREFSGIAGEGNSAERAARDELSRLIADQTFALPSFGQDDGLFPGSARKGRIEGPLPQDDTARLTLAVLTAALLTTECLHALDNQGTVVLDGAFLKDPLFAPLVAALNPGRPTCFNRQADGVAAGAALLATHGQAGRTVAVDLEQAEPLELAGLTAYAERWRSLARGGARPTG